MREPLYITIVDIGFGISLSLLLEFLLNLFSDLQTATASLCKAYLGLQVYTIFFILVITVEILLKWGLYRETFVKGLTASERCADCFERFINENIIFLVLYLVIEFLLILSPVVYYYIRKIYLTKFLTKISRYYVLSKYNYFNIYFHFANINLILDNFYYGAVLSINYFMDTFITKKGGLYDRLKRELETKCDLREELQSEYVSGILSRIKAISSSLIVNIFNIAAAISSFILFVVPLAIINVGGPYPVLMDIFDSPFLSTYFYCIDYFLPDLVTLAIVILSLDNLVSYYTFTISGGKAKEHFKLHKLKSFLNSMRSRIYNSLEIILRKIENGEPTTEGKVLLLDLRRTLACGS